MAKIGKNLYALDSSLFTIHVHCWALFVACKLPVVLAKDLTVVHVKVAGKYLYMFIDVHVTSLYFLGPLNLMLALQNNVTGAYDYFRLAQNVTLHDYRHRVQKQGYLLLLLFFY